MHKDQLYKVVQFWVSTYMDCKFIFSSPLCFPVTNSLSMLPTQSNRWCDWIQWGQYNSDVSVWHIVANYIWGQISPNIGRAYGIHCVGDSLNTTGIIAITILEINQFSTIMFRYIPFRHIRVQWEVIGERRLHRKIGYTDHIRGNWIDCSGM